MVKLAPYNTFRPTGIFLLAVLLWIFLFFEFNISYAVLSVPCDHLLGKGLPLALFTGYFLSLLSLSCVVSWVICGI